MLCGASPATNRSEKEDSELSSNMSDMKLLRTLVAEKLAAAAEQIFTAVERLITQKQMMLTTEMSPAQQKAVVHQRLSVVADEIFRILETMMGEYEAEETRHRSKLPDVMLKTETNLHSADRFPLSGPDTELQMCKQNGSLTQVQVTPDSRQFNDASMKTDYKLTRGKSSYPHRPRRAEEVTLTMAKTEGEHSAVPLSDGEELSTQHSEAGSEDGDSDAELKSSKRNQNLDGDQRKIHKGLAGEKIGTHASQTTGRSCCRVCGKSFQYRRSFLKHVLMHEHGTDLCGVCGKHLDSGESLKAHLQTHSEENCSSGDQEDGKRSDAEGKADDSDRESKETDDDRESDKNEIRELPLLEKPESKAGGKGSNKPKRFKNEQSKGSSPLKYRCKVCDKPFSYRASFMRHVQEDERDTDLCGVCGKHFESGESLRLHLQTYVRANDCDICGKHFNGHKQLEMHMRTHTGEKPYICSVCGKAFAQNGNLMGHMRVHTGEKPYVCNVCGQSFSFKEYMMAHMRIHSGEKPFLCSVCGKGFRQRGTLKTHTMIHTGETSHQCSICDKRFYKSGALKTHMRSHTGERPYLCNICGKSFTASGSLTKHMAAHEGKRLRLRILEVRAEKTCSDPQGKSPQLTSL